MVLSHFQVKPLLRLEVGDVRVSLDLNRTTVDAKLSAEGLLVPPLISRAFLKKIAKDENGCFLIDEEGNPSKIQFFSELTSRAYSLFPTGGAPTMRVGGFPMHRIKDCDPDVDTRNKIASVGRLHGEVLDICTGLGYTAIHAARVADSVTTIELDPCAIEVCRLNPWSEELFTNPKITSRIDDAFELLPTLGPGRFSFVFHDPPTMQLAGELYSGEMYARIRRVLKRGGKLFHYIGDPESPFGKSMTQGVIKRLKEAGFAKVERHSEAFGVVAS